MINYVINIINVLVQLITLLVIIKVFLSYFMSPYHPVRMAIDRIVNPMLYPIQRVIPSLGMIDLSPIILIVVVQILGRIIINLLISIFH
jgi:YggT family protein